MLALLDFVLFLALVLTGLGGALFVAGWAAVDEARDRLRRWLL